MLALRLLSMFVAIAALALILYQVDQPMQATPAAPVPLLTVKWREPALLTHPLSCDGPWVKSCADFKPCEYYCNGRKLEWR